MSTLRPPVIAGLTRGAGTSTIALALHGVDAGIWAGPVGDADVLVADLADLAAWRRSAHTGRARPVRDRCSRSWTPLVAPGAEPTRER
jgi:hypothetical protein